MIFNNFRRRRSQKPSGEKAELQDRLGNLVIHTAAVILLVDDALCDA